MEYAYTMCIYLYSFSCTHSQKKRERRKGEEERRKKERQKGEEGREGERKREIYQLQARNDKNL